MFRTFLLSSGKMKTNTPCQIAERPAESVENNYAEPEIEITVSQHCVVHNNSTTNKNTRVTKPTQPRISDRVKACKIQESASPNGVHSANSRRKSPIHHNRKYIINLDKNNELRSIVLPEAAISSKYTNIPESGSGDPNKRFGDTNQLQHNLSSADTVVGDVDSSKEGNDPDTLHGNTQNALIIRQSTLDSDMELDDDNCENNKQQTEIEDEEEDSFHSYYKYIIRGTTKAWNGKFIFFCLV